MHFNTSVAKKKCKCKPWHCTNASTDCSLLSAVTFQSRLGFVKESFVATFWAVHGKDKSKRRNAHKCVKWHFLSSSWFEPLIYFSFASIHCRLTLTISQLFLTLFHDLDANFTHLHTIPLNIYKPFTKPANCNFLLSIRARGHKLMNMDNGQTL